MITVNKKKIEGIILKNSDYKDNAIKISVLTNEGIIDFIIRGAKKITSKLSNLSQPLKKVELYSTTDKVINTVTEGIVIENYTKIKEDNEKLLVSLSMIETCYYFSKHVLDSDLLYNFFLDTLEILKNTMYPLELLNYFDIKFWYLIGIQPIFNKCVICGSDEPSFFSVNHGGVLCLNCRSNSSYDEETTQLLKITYLLKIDKLNDDFLKIISEYREKFNKIIRNYYIEYFDFSNFNRNLIEKLI